MPVQAINREEILHQIKSLNLYLILFLSIIVFINILHIYDLVTYAQQSDLVPENTTNFSRKEQQQQQEDIFSILFNNSVTQMLMSTFIIAIVGLLITKLRNFKKKLDMIEVLTKAQVKFKKLADEREKNFEERFIQSQKDFSKQIGDLCSRIDKYSEHIDDKIISLDNKIENVKDEATQTLIDYLRSNSLSRKR